MKKKKNAQSLQGGEEQKFVTNLICKKKNPKKEKSKPRKREDKKYKRTGW